MRLEITTPYNGKPRNTTNSLTVIKIHKTMSKRYNAWIRIFRTHNPLVPGSSPAGPIVN